MTKRFNITVTDVQAEWLAEIAAHDQVSVSHVVRDALRHQLPRLVELKRWLANDDGAMDRDQALTLLDSMDALDGAIGQGIAVVGEADAALPVRRKSAPKPPDGNTGAHK